MAVGRNVAVTLSWRNKAASKKTSAILLIIGTILSVALPKC